MDKVEGQEEAGGSHLCSVSISKGDESGLPFSQQKSPEGGDAKALEHLAFSQNVSGRASF